jgi:hypothetical protein
MTYFNILRTRLNKFLGFNVNGFTVRSWEELQKLAESRIAKHDPSWEEIEVDGDDLKTESDEVSLKLLSELQKTVENLTNDNRDLLNRSAISEEKTRRLQSDYDSYKKHADQEHRSLKAEIITSLRAINLCLLASITTQKQPLTHRQRNFRAQHVNRIISNEIDRFADRKLIAYEDDF